MPLGSLKCCQPAHHRLPSPESLAAWEYHGSCTPSPPNINSLQQQAASTEGSKHLLRHLLWLFPAKADSPAAISSATAEQCENTVSGCLLRGTLCLMAKPAAGCPSSEPPRSTQRTWEHRRNVVHLVGTASLTP